MLNSSALDIVKKSTALERFTPNDGGQVRVAKSTAHELIVAGGNNSGKSYLGIALCGWHIVAELDNLGNPTGRTIHPHMQLRIPSAGREGWISSHSSETQRDTLRPIIDKLLKPYIIKAEYEDGIYKRIYVKGVDNPSWINFKWQTQGPRSYAGPKKQFVFMDEPHMKAIYQETRARLFKSGGYMWICMTPVVDEDSPVRSQDVIWMRDRVVEPWHRHPKDFPLRQVIYIRVQENYDYMNGEFVEGMLAGMSMQERAIRESGLFIIFSGRNAFNRDMLETTLNYLEEHTDESQPEYGKIVYYHDEIEEEWKAQFISDSRQYFDHKPQNEWTIKVWERHIDGKGLQVCPKYLIAVDVAEGKQGGDYTSVYVLRKDDKRIVAALHGHLTEQELAKQLWLLGAYYNDGGPDFDQAELVIEVRNFGGITLRYLIDGNREFGIPRYDWHQIYQRPTTRDMESNLEYASAPGWDTNSKTRRYVLAGAREAVTRAFRSIQEGKLCPIPDIGFFMEARGFIQDKDGKYQGNPDDRVITVGIAEAVMGGEGFEQLRMGLQEEEVVEDDRLWIVNINPETNSAEVQVNHDSILTPIIQPAPTQINF
jgi:hypothetical protein